jgi:Domain of unknown function (DUF4136)
MKGPCPHSGDVSGFGIRHSFVIRHLAFVIPSSFLIWHSSFLTPLSENKYMKTHTYALIVAGALALAGCSSVKTHVDTGPIHARTFSYINTGSRELPAYAENRKLVYTKVQEAISKNLTGKGLTQVGQGGDITVAYLVIVGNNAATTSLNDYFGYSADADALVNKVHKSDTVKGNERGYFEAGTLVIDILDPQTSKLLKRETVQAQILRELPLDEREARLQQFVDQALSDLRVVQ